MCTRVLLIVLIILLVWYANAGEGFFACTYCDTYSPTPATSVVLNPFVWPYSGTGSIDDVYVVEKDSENGGGTATMYNQFTPDHALKTE